MNWLKSKKIIAVHSGSFHADDVFSAATFSLLFDNKIKVIRTRDPKELVKADYILDVGQEYDPRRNKFDHHLSGDILRRPNGVPYASFGLIWKEFGPQLCSSREVVELVDRKLVQSIDAHDNGFSLSKNNILGISDYEVSDYIHSVNAVCEENMRDKAFKKLIKFASDLVLVEIKFAEIAVRDEAVIIDSYNLAVDKRIIVLDRDCLGLSILSNYAEPIFVIKPSPEQDLWKIYTVKEKENIYQNRLSLPDTWAGKSAEELAKLTSVEDALYSDHRLFMAITKSKEGAIKLAQLALNNNK